MIGDIHWVELPDAGGREQAGRRPAIVMQDDAYAGRLPTTIVIPLSSALATLRFPGTGSVYCRVRTGLKKPWSDVAAGRNSKRSFAAYADVFSQWVICKIPLYTTSAFFIDLGDCGVLTRPQLGVIFPIVSVRQLIVRLFVGIG